MVCGIIGGVLTTSHCAYFIGSMSLEFALPFWAIIWACVPLALWGLEAMLRRDPGLIHRTAETSAPYPQAVVDALRQGARESLTENIQGIDGRSFCVRCFVWRPKRSHHCKVCARCVEEFDHHCIFFQRCISGKGWGGGDFCLRTGNWRPFVALVAAGALSSTLGLLYCALCLLSWADALEVGWASAVVFGVLTCCCIFPIGAASCGLAARCFVPISLRK